MKKLLLILLVICSIVTFGQPLQTTVVFYEDFNTYTGNVSTDIVSSGTFLSTDVHRVKFVQDPSTQPVQQWKMNFKHPIAALQSQAFPNDGPYCMYSTTNVNGNQWVGTLAVSKVRSKPILTLQNVSGMTKAYLSFSQICKLHPYDSCYVEIQCTNDTLQTNWTVTKRLNFNLSSCYYFGSATSVGQAGVWSMGSYSTWAPDANPQHSWWKEEMFDITQFIEPGYQYMRIVFAEQYYGLQQPTGRGWFIDNVKVTYANAEIHPPEMPLSGSTLITGNRNNETGPWNISVKMRDRDTIDLTSIQLTYTVRGVAQPNLTTAITANTATGSGLCRWHNVTANWVIPSLCYGDTVDYTITACDVHGSCTSESYQFIPRSTKLNITANDVEMINIVNIPSCVRSHHDTIPVLARFLNRSMNDMTHLKVETTVVRKHRGNTTTTNLPDAEWFWTNNTESFCMDWIDTVLAVNYIPVEPGWYTITVSVKERNHAPDDGTLSNNTIVVNFFACDSALNGAYTYGADVSAIRNMQELKDYLRCCGIAGDVVLNMAAGNYGNITFQDTIYDGQDLYSITFQSANGNPADVHIYDYSTQNTYGAITLQGVKGFVFNNLTIHGKTSGTASLGVSFINKGSENITISNCNILINNASSRTNTSYSGIARLTANVTSSIPDNNVSIVNNQISGGNFGVYYKGGTGATQKNLI